MGKFVHNNKSIAVLFLLTVAIVLGILVLVRLESIGDEEVIIKTQEIEENGESKQKTIFVDVSGEVKKPGVYQLKEGSIVKDAIDKAGGFSKEADLSYVSESINQAAILTDEQKIYIPKKGVAKDASSSGIEVQSSNGSLINLNTASLSELDSLPGIGPTYAQRIIDSRPFSSTEDLKNIKGIGEATYEKIKNKVTI